MSRRAACGYAEAVAGNEQQPFTSGTVEGPATVAVSVLQGARHPACYPTHAPSSTLLERCVATVFGVASGRIGGGGVDGADLVCVDEQLDSFVGEVFSSLESNSSPTVCTSIPPCIAT
jgi:hypothetical protein